MLKKKWVKIVLIILGSFAVLYGVIFLINVLVNISLRNYIKTFAPVEYSENRIVPYMDNDTGYMTITTDEELKVMHLTDIHIGGGFLSYKNDKKTIYELITMLQKEKPDVVVMGGDNTYCILHVGFNGGLTFNNKMVAKTLLSVFDNEQVYFTTVFGNHDSEAMDYYSRQDIGDLYMSGYTDYCFFNQDYTDTDAKTVPSVTNQIVVVKGTDGKIRKLLLLIDSNAYVDTSFISTVKGSYDVIHDAQIEWAKEAIADLSKAEGMPDGEYLKTICFMHIPVGEYRVALDELITEVSDSEGNIVAYVQNESSMNTEFVDGHWDESICYGGRYNPGTPENQDNFFEEMCEKIDCVEAIFCGHDHVNNGVVKYKGVMLAYGYSVDNEAYGDKIMNSGLQRGATVITIEPDGTFTQVHKNAYTDYGCETDKFVPVYLDHTLYENSYRTVTNK